MMNINFHTENVKEFYVRGHANIHERTKNVYTVLQIGVKTNEGYNDIFIYPSIEQLEQMKKAIDEAIEEAKRLNISKTVLKNFKVIDGKVQKVDVDE